MPAQSAAEPGKEVTIGCLRRARSPLAVDTPQRPHSNPVRTPAVQAIRARAMALTALAYRRIQSENSSDARWAFTEAGAQPRASLIENQQPRAHR